jgi:hypothetical protein
MAAAVNAMGYRTVRLAYCIGPMSSEQPRFGAATAKAVLVRLAESVDDESGAGAYPAVATIARETSLTSRSVKRALQWLLTDGWIEVQSPGGGRRKTVTYRLVLERLRAQQLAPSLPMTSSASVRLFKTVTVGPETVTVGPRNGDRGAERVTEGPQRVTEGHPIHTERSEKNKERSRTARAREIPLTRDDFTTEDQWNGYVDCLLDEGDEDGDDLDDEQFWAELLERQSAYRKVVAR